MRRSPVNMISYHSVSFTFGCLRDSKPASCLVFDFAIYFKYHYSFIAARKHTSTGVM